ncbi:glycosyltransferase family 9 protein [Thiomicrorhabdus sp. 6S2-11]|uniref:Glycosyltransferase family 9 protein n=1 Tax=Thiomicrorhabdus marina TaxID=2818442 RepID=A0ABS3Q5Q6_9GAMM|nr:glycosyltransferase family 9 protein [Thiomicrorhabdus marina]MBO1927657.1 glycosyltransferase family 9 protein [Thiomicrorhabdus marina]
MTKSNTKIHKILLVRMSAMGDIVMATPLLKAIKRRYPQAEISWAVQPEFADVIRGHELLDELIIIPKGQWTKDFKALHWVRLWKEIRRLKKQLRAAEFDLAIDLQSLAKSGILVKWSQAKRKIGLNSREGSQKWMDEVVDGSVVTGELISSEYQAMAEYLGCSIDSFQMRLPANLDTPSWKEITTELGSDYLVFCPFTTRPQKHWFDENWQALAALLPANKKIAILGGPGDTVAAESLMKNMPGNVVNLVGKTRIQEAIAVIRHSNGVIGVDTGLTHMGIAENKPTLALFGSTLPYSNTRSAKAKVLYHQLDCSPCRRNPTCEGRFDCMRALSPEWVLQEWQVLNQGVNVEVRL